MGTIKNFEDLEVWKMSRELVNLIYSDTFSIFQKALPAK
jgi:hypothetical protein